MECIRKQLKLATLFLNPLVLCQIVLCQSCRVYKHKYKSVSLKTDLDKGRRVKIRTKDSKVYKFKKIVFERDSFYKLKRNPIKNA